MRYQDDLVARCVLRVDAGESIRRQNIKQLTFVKAHVLYGMHLVQEFVHQQTTTRRRDWRCIRVLFTNNDVSKMWWIERSEILNFNLGPRLQRAFKELRILKVRIVANDRHLYSSMTRHSIERHFVCARTTHLQLFGETALRLQTNSRIHVCTREVQNDSQTVQLCGSGLANAATDNISQCRFANTHV